jgi:uncharacterized membrane protein
MLFGVVCLAAMLTPALVIPGWAATGAVYVEIAKAGFIIGVGGRGTLVFQGGVIRCASMA